MTVDARLIIAARATTGELVIAANRRTALDDEGSIFIDDTSCKLIDFAGAVIGVAGKCGEALLVIHQFIAESERDSGSCHLMAKRLNSFFTKWYSADRTKWPLTQVTYCDWLGDQGRIFYLSSRCGFFPEEAEVSYTGNSAMASLLRTIVGVGEETYGDIEKFCAVALALTAEWSGANPSAGPLLSSLFKPGSVGDVWVLHRSGLVKRTDQEVMVTLSRAIKRLDEVRKRFYEGL